MRLIIWSLVAILAALTLFVYIAQQRAAEAIEMRSGLMQVEFDKAIQGLQDARFEVCDGVCPKG